MAKRRFKFSGMVSPDFCGKNQAYGAYKMRELSKTA